MVGEIASHALDSWCPVTCRIKQLSSMHMAQKSNLPFPQAVYFLKAMPELLVVLSVLLQIPGNRENMK